MGLSGVYVHESPDRVIAHLPLAQVGPGTTTLLSSTLARRHKIKAALLTLSADGTVKFRGSVSGDLTGPMDVAAKGGFVLPESLSGLIQTDLNEDIQIVTTGGAANGAVEIVTEA